MKFPAQEISHQKLLGQLQDHGNTATIRHYLDILKGGFLLETLEKFSGSAVRQKSSSPKIIAMAPALIHAFSDPREIDNDPEWRGRVFESAIGAHLLRTGCDLFYWRDGDLEVDFVAEFGNELFGIEVKSGRRKRSHGIIEFKKRFPKAKTIIYDWESGGRFLSSPATKDSMVEAGGYLG
jgi:predicted AAA+ superfamily ATPase